MLFYEFFFSNVVLSIEFCQKKKIINERGLLGCGPIELFILFFNNFSTHKKLVDTLAILVLQKLKAFTLSSRVI